MITEYSVGQNKPTPEIIVREKKMVEAMVKIYCNDNHRTKNLICEKCTDLGDYSKGRLDNCRYQENKPVFGRCGLKCYNAKSREEAEKMFTYAGPRMFLKHPFLGIQHIFDAFKNNDSTKE